MCLCECVCLCCKVASADTFVRTSHITHTHAQTPRTNTAHEHRARCVCVFSLRPNQRHRSHRTTIATFTIHGCRRFAARSVRSPVARSCGCSIVRPVPARAHVRDVFVVVRVLRPKIAIKIRAHIVRQSSVHVRTAASTERPRSCCAVSLRPPPLPSPPQWWRAHTRILTHTHYAQASR